jgi:tetratricopeptide (TPR) repeat protein
MSQLDCSAVRPSLSRAALPIVLFLATLAVFSRSSACGFVNYDDELYVTRNPHVAVGLTRQSAAWALTATDASNWHPATWLSLQLDSSIYGPNRPWGFHLTNVLLHAANTVLLYWVLWRMTGAEWRCALAAALFGLHPLHVESVAWVAERKDVLSTFFGLLAVGAYAGYAVRPRAGGYVGVLLCLALSLAAKPMFVTLPALLLLLDYWPLRRTALPWTRLLAEKLPLVAVAAASAAVTLFAQAKGGSVNSLGDIPLAWRVQAALVAYVGYLGKAFWPAYLAPFYPHPGGTLSWWQSVAAGLLLAAVTAAVLAAARRRPYLALGWLWYLIALVPVIGLVQVGWQGMADRYTYVPLIGPFIAVSWGLADLVGRWRVAAAAVAAAGLSACAALSWIQVGYWHDSLTLWNHTLQGREDNLVAHYCLGLALADQGRTDAAVAHYRRSLELKPDHPEAHYALAQAFLQHGQYGEAIRHLEATLTLKPRYAEAENNLGLAYQQRGDFEEAARHYTAALEIEPRLAAARHNLHQVAATLNGRAQMLFARQDLDGAVVQYRAALRADPAYTQAYDGLGLTLLQQGKTPDALDQFAAALRANPGDADAYYNQGLARCLQGNLGAARDCFWRALERHPTMGKCYYALGHVLLDAGEADRAREAFRRARYLDPAWPPDADRFARTLSTHPDSKVRNGELALLLARQVCEATDSGQAEFLDTLAAACAETGRFAEAESAACRAVELAAGSPEQVAGIRHRLELYRKRLPFHDALPKPAG